MTPPDDDTDRAPETENSEIWRDRVLYALDALGSLDKALRSRREPRIYPTSTRVKEMVAARFAPYFTRRSRLFDEELRPGWERQVAEAVDGLVERKLVAWRPLGKTAAMPGNDNESLRFTKLGQAEAKAACQRAELLIQHADLSPDEPVLGEDLLLAGVLTQPLREGLAGRSDAKDLGPQPEESPLANVPHPIMIELNLHYGGGLLGAFGRVDLLWKMMQGPGTLTRTGDRYMTGRLTIAQMQAIISADAAGGGSPKRAIVYIWPDFKVTPQIDASCTTIKALPAQRSFGAFGDEIVWAVLDSGIQHTHPHFAGYNTLDDPLVRDLHRDFTQESDDPALALIDATGHGTHVAGIIAGGLQCWKPDEGEDTVIAVEDRGRGLRPRAVKRTSLEGMAPRAKLISLKVLGGGGDDEERVGRVIEALAYVNRMNGNSAERIHGVNLSLGYRWKPEWSACGQSPICVAVDNLVRSGVVVVVAAGNSGYVTLNTVSDNLRRFTAGQTINDPGNAARAITVGSTHRESPHTSGISYFSSRGPTADGRAKPDLVAPGENVLSAAAGSKLARLADVSSTDLEKAAVYIEDDGTSMAAPHVSGAIAAFLSVQRELIGQPEEIKRIFMGTATSLRRDPNFQGAGLVDLMRALQAQ